MTTIIDEFPLNEMEVFLQYYEKELELLGSADEIETKDDNNNSCDDPIVFPNNNNNNNSNNSTALEHNNNKTNIVVGNKSSSSSSSLSLARKIAILRYQALTDDSCCHCTTNTTTDDRNTTTTTSCSNSDSIVITQQQQQQQQQQYEPIGCNIGLGLATQFIQQLDCCIKLFYSTYRQQHWIDDVIIITKRRIITLLLHRIIQLLICICYNDRTLCEELARHGLHRYCIQLMNYQIPTLNNNNNNDNDDNDNYDNDDDNNPMYEIHDLVGELITTFTIHQIPFPCMESPYTIEELYNRLPLRFPFVVSNSSSSNNIVPEQQQQLVQKQHNSSSNKNSNTNSNSNNNQPTSSLSSYRKTLFENDILIHQVTVRQSAQHDVGFVVWPSAVVLSRWLQYNLSSLLLREVVSLSNEDYSNDEGIRNDNNNNTTPKLRILELGAGCGLTGLVVAKQIQLLLQLQQQQQQQSHGADSSSGTTIQQPLLLSPIQVYLSDFNTIVLQNLQRNIELNNVTNICTTVGVDFYHYLQDDDGRSNNNNNEENNTTTTDVMATTATTTTSSLSKWIDMDGTLQEYIDIVIGADIICQESDSYACAATLRSILRPHGGRAYIICATSQHRYGVDVFPKAIEQQYDSLHLVSVSTFHPSTTDITSIVPTEQQVIQNNNNTVPFDLQHDLEQTAGYVPNMELTMFVIEKR